MPDIDINEMTDEEFIEYIEDLENKSGGAGAEDVNNPSVVDGESEPSGAPAPTNTGASEGNLNSQDINPTTAGALPLPLDKGGLEDAEYDKGLADGRNARLISHIKSLYPDMDEGAAIEQFLEDSDRDEAEAAGLTLEDYRNEKAEQAEFADFKAERERKRQNDEAVAGIVERWKADSERMKGILPEFDFEKAMENGQFRDKVIKEGKDIITAYFELNPINKAPAASQRRDIEVGDMSGGISGGFKSPFDVERASEEEFSRYIARILDK